MGRRTLLLIAALVVAALGTILIFVYVRNADERAQADAEPVEVLVATKQVTVGTTAGAASENGAFELQTLPQSAVAEGALPDISIIADKSALTTIFPGQQILAQMFGQPQSVSGLNVPKDKLAMSVQLGDPERVAGFVVPGSEVTIFYTDPESNTMTIVPSVEVLATGTTTLSTQTTTSQSGDSTTAEIPQTILTLETDQAQAQRIITAQSDGQLYFGLLGDDIKTRTGRITTPNALRR
jgi:pilus assembly protein CpaB